MSRVNDDNYLAKISERMYRCPICGVDCDDKDSFRMHVQAQHPKRYEKMDLDKLDDLESYNNGDTDVLNF